MTEAMERVRELARSMDLEFPEDRLAQVAAGWEATLAEIETIRVQPTEQPDPTAYDPAWSEKK